MKKNRLLTSFFSFIITASLLMTLGSDARADSNYTSAVKFGFGAQINPHTDNIDTVVRNASQIGFNWLAVEFDWAQRWPDASQPIDLDQLNQAAIASRPYQANLMISIKNPPGWALTTQGPNPDYVTALVTTIMQSFPDIIGAIELLPGANQASQWGAPANPALFAQIIKQSQTNVALYNPRAVVIASITPLGESRQVGDLDDLEFLSALYQADGDLRFPVIGLNFSTINGEPAQDPLTDSAHNLRHYEDVRRIMLDYGHSSDLIWVTSFSWPNSLKENQDQADWLFTAYKLLRTQLFIGAAFFKNLNSSETSNAEAYLINQNIITHPAVFMLQQLTISNHTDTDDPDGIYQPANNGLSKFLGSLWEKIRSWLGI
jgi:hypothetical protein